MILVPRSWQSLCVVGRRMYLTDVVDREGLRSLVTHFNNTGKRTSRFKARLLQLVAIVAGLIAPSAFALSSVTVGWNASSDPSVTGYKIYYGSSSGAYTNAVAVGNTTT